MLRIAIVGCGKIADSHACQIKRIADSQLVAVCDRERLMAQQLQERFRVKQSFVDVDKMLREVKPDVVHITTPPQSHFELAQYCLENACHVYVEKPFTLDTAEAEKLLALASHKGLKITAGHDDQFSPVARRMRALIRLGYLGGPPVHMESYYGYELGDGYARALLGDRSHWVRRLPGGLLHNIISHGIARIAEFLCSENPEVLARGFISPLLQTHGEQELVDELRVIISEPPALTAYFTFSTQMRPALHQFRIFGPRNGIFIDADQQTLVRLRGQRYKSYLEKFLPPLLLAGQHLGSLKTNVRLFFDREFQMKSGMHFLIESFYSSIKHDSSPPISHREILLTSKLMEAIFVQIGKAQNSKFGPKLAFGAPQVCSA